MLFEVSRLFDAGFLSLRGNLFLSLTRCRNAPHRVKGVHVKGQVKQSPLVVGHRGIHKVVKVTKRCHKLPDCLVIGMKDVGAVPVYVDSFHDFGINIAPNVGSLIYDKTRLSCGPRAIGKYGTE